MGKTLAIKNINTTVYHPQSNGLVERFHRTLKAALMATGEPAGWMGRLSHVLLGIRTAQRADAGFSPAECVYGTNLVLPGQLPVAAEPPELQQPLQDFTTRLKADMAAAKCPEHAWHTTTTRSPIPAALREAEHVFVRHGARRIPLTRPYDGPFRVLKKEDKFFLVKVGAKEQTISVDRLKPAFGFADPVPKIPKLQAKKTPTEPKTPGVRKTLNPAAEVFIPAKVVSRAGRTIKPPVRLGL